MIRKTDLIFLIPIVTVYVIAVEIFDVRPLIASLISLLTIPITSLFTSSRALKASDRQVAAVELEPLASAAVTAGVKPKNDKAVNIATVISIGTVIFMVLLVVYNAPDEPRPVRVVSTQDHMSNEKTIPAKSVSNCVEYDESRYSFEELFDLKRILEKAMATGQVTSMEIDLFQLVLDKRGRICDDSLQATLEMLTLANECNKLFYWDILRSYDAEYVVVSPERFKCEADLFGVNSQESQRNNQNIQKVLMGQPVSSEYGTIYMDVSDVISAIALADLKTNAVKSLFTR